MSIIRVTGFKWVPPFAQGLVRDLRVRWALEEAGLPYEEKLLGQGDQNTPEYRAIQPFGQVPVYEEGDLKLFESGSIVLHIAEKSPVLMPKDPAARARVVTWMFAALNSVEPALLTYSGLDTFFAKEEWARLRKPSALAMAQTRLKGLAAGLGDREYFEQQFSAADILMTSVLRFVKHLPLVAEIPTLAAYQARCEARPAFKRALAAQLAPFEKYAPAAA
jgi:glutathione S-transferase